MTVLRSWALDGTELPSRMTVTGGKLAGSPVMTRMAQRLIDRGRSAEEALAALDGYSNGAVIWSVDKPPPLPAWAGAGGPAQRGGLGWPEAERWDPGKHPRDHAGKFARAPGGTGAAAKQVAALSPVYNEIPETRGTGRGKGTFEVSGRAAADSAAISAWRQGHPVAPPITKAEARDGARPVSEAEFQDLARQGLNQLGMMAASRQPIHGLDSNWDKIKSETYRKVLQPWGGATIDPKTGHALPDGADKYALTVKPKGMQPVSVRENPTQAEFDAAMERARAEFRRELEKGSHYLGVFHDDDEGRIDIDPVVVVDTKHEVETIGAYTHAIGGAYHFATGNGFWPPYVDEAMRFDPRQPRNPVTGEWAHVGTSSPASGGFSFEGPPGGTGHARAMEALARALEREPGNGQAAQVLRLAIHSMMARDLPAARRHIEGAIFQDQVQTGGKFRPDLEAVRKSLEAVPRKSVREERLPAVPPSLAGKRKGLSPGVIGEDASGAPAQSFGYGAG